MKPARKRIPRLHQWRRRGRCRDPFPTSLMMRLGRSPSLEFENFSESCSPRRALCHFFLRLLLTGLLHGPPRPPLLVIGHPLSRQQSLSPFTVSPLTEVLAKYHCTDYTLLLHCIGF
uniref:Uncharacterized protein n=1 Tax=Cacopsylla melanoneura TaxID=428564 RepID=A0A8D8V0M9_9HEMI